MSKLKFVFKYITKSFDRVKQARQKNELSFSNFIYCTFECIPQLYEILKYALIQYNINLKRGIQRILRAPENMT